MSTLFLTHDACLDHDTGEYHPESADRLKSIIHILEHEDFSFLFRDEAPQASMEQLRRAHPESHIAEILAPIAAGDFKDVDSDTILSSGTAEAALRSAGAVCYAIDEVMAGKCRNAFCAVRPPGHHAEKQQAMGFCLFGNAAIGALHARDAHGLQRVAVIDFDVHHGNGTQQILWDEPGMFYGSTHQLDAFPYTGGPEERGPDNGCRVINIPLPAGSGSEPFRMAYSDGILPALDDFAPQLLIISAGFDAHAADPMAHLRLQVSDFTWLTRQLLDIARKHCASRVVSVLEGGYDTRALAACVAAHMRALMDG
ncbi:MAG TPA: histone deacetylase family protein [Rhodospirillaceae bacterium]|nr:histone deacetylase family protein [Rhodospirillaceae bacterium]